MTLGTTRCTELVSWLVLHPTFSSSQSRASAPRSQTLQPPPEVECPQAQSCCTSVKTWPCVTCSSPPFHARYNAPTSGQHTQATLTFQQLHDPRLHHADDRDVGVGPRHSLHSIASTHQRGSAITPCNAPATVLPRTWQYDANVYPPEERTEAPGLCTKLRAWTLLAAPAGKLTR